MRISLLAQSMGYIVAELRMWWRRLLLYTSSSFPKGCLAVRTSQAAGPSEFLFDEKGNTQTVFAMYGIAFACIIADGHTVLNAPDLFRPPKLSSTGPG